MALSKHPRDVFNDLSQRSNNDITLDAFVDVICRPATAPNHPPAMTSQQIQQFQKMLSFIEFKDSSSPTARIVGAHLSKSVPLPVVEITLPRNLGKIVMRDNFHDLKISFELNVDLPEDTFGKVGFFKQGYKIDAVYCEGFDEKRVYGLFSENRSHFTIETACLGRGFAENLIAQVCEVLDTLTAPPPAPAPINKTANIPPPKKSFDLK